MGKARGVFLLLLGVSPWTANAARYDEARKTAEASMGLTGVITVGPDGKVREYSIDKSDKVAAPVLALLKSNVEQWQFEPMRVDGKPVSIKNKMYLNLIAQSQDSGNYEVRIGSAAFRPFVEPKPDKREKPGQDMRPPQYPGGAMMAEMQGTVYLILKLNPDGSVQDVFAEKTNLRFLSNPRTMDAARKAFSQSSIRAARSWKFSTDGLDEDMQVRVPVDFCMDSCDDKYGQWRAYIPGPTQRAPWQKPEIAAGFSPDALPANDGVFPVGETGGAKLLTPLQGGS